MGGVVEAEGDATLSFNGTGEQGAKRGGKCVNFNLHFCQSETRKNAFPNGVGWKLFHFQFHITTLINLNIN